MVAGAEAAPEVVKVMAKEAGVQAALRAEEPVEKPARAGQEDSRGAARQREDLSECRREVADRWGTPARGRDVLAALRSQQCGRRRRAGTGGC